MSENIYCRIPVKGNYLGRQCPCDGIRLTISTYRILKAAGIPLEIYDPRKVAKEKETKKVETGYVAETVVIDEFEVKEELEVVQDKLDYEEEAESEINNFDELFTVKDDEYDIVINKILNDYKDDEMFEESDVEDNSKNYIYYSEEDLMKLTRDELVAILVSRGHTGGRDFYAAKQKDNKSKIIKKILDTNPIE